jgi:hypothetical protein
MRCFNSANLEVRPFLNTATESMGMILNMHIAPTTKKLSIRDNVFRWHLARHYSFKVN